MRTSRDLEPDSIYIHGSCSDHYNILEPEINETADLYRTYIRRTCARLQVYCRTFMENCEAGRRGDFCRYSS